MSFFHKLFGVQPKKSQAVSVETAAARQENAYLTETVVFGMHPYRSAGEDSTVYLINQSLGIRKKLIDSIGNIMDFPGMVKEKFWVEEVAPNYLKPQVRFRSSFEPRENGWIFKWQVQPDGWYWADEDGFGGEDDLEVILYTYVDREGRYSGPFKIYQLGSVGYSMDRFTGDHACSLQTMLDNIRDDEQHMICPGDMFPQLLGAKTEYHSDHFYQLRDKAEAIAYWNDPILSRDLKVLAQALLESPKSLWNIMRKNSGRVKGCMTLFYLISGEPVFKQVLDKFFDGKQDEYTVEKLNES